MKDQAESLRRRLQQKGNDHQPKTLAVVSGKGGVGKSNFSLNFAISLSTKGHKVLLFDMDLGMGNIDILLGNSSPFTIIDYFEGEVHLKDIVMEGPNQLHYIAGGTGLNHLLKLNEEQVQAFIQELASFLGDYEYVILDMGAGATEESLRFILSVDQVILLTTPEPTSITDAYAMLKHIHLLNGELPFLVVVNRVLSEKDGKNTFNRLQTVSKRFLGRELLPLGMIPDDRAIPAAVNKQTPFILNEKSAASKALVKIVDRFLEQSYVELNTPTAFHFVSKLKRFLFER